MSTLRNKHRNDIFVPGIGQYENIGDIILRRQLLRWLRPVGKLHVYIGRSPDGYADGLELSSDDRVYESFSSWYRVAMACALRGTASYVFKPGEIQLTLAGLKEHVSMLPLALLARMRGGSVVRVGAGARNFAPLPRALMWPSLLIPQRTWWRDPRTAAYLGGGVMPDLAFAEGDDQSRFNTVQRDTLVVSMRGDRSRIPDAWVEGVRIFAARHDLKICVVTQVLRDADLSRSLAAALGGTFVNWDGSDHRAKEAELNDIYRRTLLTISDRLHVLIAAYTHGAVPVGLQTDDSDKIRRHFEAIEVENVACNGSRLSAAELDGLLEKARQNGATVLAALPAARVRLEAIRNEVAALLNRQ